MAQYILLLEPCAHMAILKVFLKLKGRSIEYGPQVGFAQNLAVKGQEIIECTSIHAFDFFFFALFFLCLS